MKPIGDFYTRLIPYLPFIILACAAITAVWHIEFYSGEVKLVGMLNMS